MPRVQQYKQQVTSQVVQGARAPMLPDAAFDTGVQDLLRVGGQAAQVGFQMHERAQTQRAKDAAFQFEREKNELFNEYYKFQGRDAVDNAEVYNKKLHELKELHAKGLDGTALENFNNVATHQLIRGIDSISQYSNKNMQAWEAANRQAEMGITIDNAATLAQAGVNHPEGKGANPVDVQYNRGLQAVYADLKAKGMFTQELIDKATNDYKSSLYSTAILANIGVNSETGQKALDKWGENLSFEHKAEMTEQLRKRKKKEAKVNNDNIVHSLAQEVFGSYLNTADLTKTLDMIRNNNDLTAEQKVDVVDALQILIKDRQYEAWKKAEEMVVEGAGKKEIEDSDEWPYLTPDAKLKVKKGEIFQSRWVEYYSIVDGLTDDQIAKIDFRKEHHDKFSPAQLDTFEKKQKLVIKGGVDKSDKLVLSAAANMYGKAEKWTDDVGLTKQGEKAEAYMAHIHGLFAGFEQDFERFPNVEEMETIIDRLETDITYDPEGYWNAAHREFTVNIKEEGVSEADVYTIGVMMDYIPRLANEDSEEFKQFMTNYSELKHEGVDINIFNLMPNSKRDPITIPDEHESVLIRMLDARSNAGHATDINQLKEVYKHLRDNKVRFTFDNVMTSYEQAITR
jgi:hypothetical protein